MLTHMSHLPSMRNTQLCDKLHAMECGPWPIGALAVHFYHQVGVS